ncbi:aromatic ring-hydroxylating oxygenase subunit alpha [Emcibacter sp.]|uniref:aromatic ring-hydroxylating oxygenase subunit alpha n=1 Tax=Emcibacter sp. TaxID=1979954 RepID=UPI002AA658A6|nr:SRPBCC family protein [Emcibacter sp.]
MDMKQQLGNEAEKLLHYVESGTTDSAETTYEVPASAYLDPDYFGNEMEKIFHALPLLAGLSVEIPKPGDYKAFDLLGKPIILTRKKDGGVAAMFNVCTHRGMTLVENGYGNKNLFSCTYHAWCFKNDGRLQGVADQQKFGSVDKESRNLTTLPCVEAAGIIWVLMKPGGTIDIEAHLGDMLKDLEAYELEKWHFCGTRHLKGANWKIAYDGYLEGYHFAAAHPETIHPRTFSNIMHFTAMGPHMRVGFPQVCIKEKLGGLPRETWGDNENNGYDFIRTIFPNVSLFFAPELTQVAQLVPGPTANKNETNLMFIRREPPKDDEDQAAITGMMDFLKKVVQEEDYDLGLQVQRGLQAGALKSVVFGKNERGNQYFHKYVDYFVSDDPNKVPPTL